MKLTKFLVGAVAIGLFAAGPADAGWKLVDHAKQVKVAKGKLRVTPGESWNRDTHRPIKQGEIWTLDGTGLNELYFVGGLAEGMTLFPDVDKKHNPLPTLKKSMLLTDIPDFYESSTRVALKTSLFEIEKVEPATFVGKPGISFTFRYGVEESPVLRKGIAHATLVDGNLYMITFIAPSLFYYDRDLAKAEAIMDSATL